jgi:hypothetical protein
VLAAIDNPLASCDYWGEINRALAADPTLVVPPKTKSDPAQHAKIVFEWRRSGTGPQAGLRQSTMIDGEWRCWGGTKMIIRSWKIDSSDLTLQPSWLYKVPQPHAGHDGPPLGSVSPGEE